ncbi:MAG: hypothetical protein LBD70_07280 [Bifidobacteriaceae bacterium]|jgi:type I restriction enzyme R subunit|nr:hypothetical protein [Bifidobacteriaceae bacterium]
MRAVTETRTAKPSSGAIGKRARRASGDAWRAAGIGRARPGSRHALIVDLLKRAGWTPDQVQRGYELRPEAAPPSVSRRRHHGSRDDRVSYLLSSRPGTPTAVIATVGSQHDPATGLPRAIRQGAKLDVPLAYATNGRALIEYFIASARALTVQDLASPVRSWRSYLRMHHLRREGSQLLSQPLDQDILSDGDRRFALRYYQTVALGRVLGAISRDQRRVLAHLPAGGGATVVATALMAKFASRQLAAHPDRPCRLLYLDDRADGGSQSGRLAAVRRLAENTQAELVIGSIGDAPPPAAPDLIVLNLVHGGQAADPATWRGVLERFPQAFQVGLVGVSAAKAAPGYEDFGRPVYQYTTAQARSDGYLPSAPVGVADPAEAGPEELDSPPGGLRADRPDLEAADRRRV